MIWNYLKIALRRMRREKIYAAISILSLAAGLAVSLLIGLDIYHELSWNDFHDKADRVYRVADSLGGAENIMETALPPTPTGPAMVEEFPAVDRAVRIKAEEGATTRNGRRFEERVLAVDSTFFDVFTFPLRYGRASEVLRDPSSAVLSAEAARRLFDSENPVGEVFTVRLRDEVLELTVDGVTEPVPSNSSIRFDVLISKSRFAQVEEHYGTGRWRGGGRMVTYLEVGSPASVPDIESKLPAFARRHMGKQAAFNRFYLQPLDEVHFETGVFGALGSPRSMNYVYLLGGIGLLVVLIAGINFVTISLGRSADRYREIGIRKTVGARRTQVAMQFWGETVLSALLGFAVAGLMAALTLPVFNRLIGKDLSLALAREPGFILGAIGVLIVVALMAGSYPSMVLSRPQPVRVFSGIGTAGHRAAVVKGLLVLQLGVGAALVVGVFVMNQQLSFLRSHDPGFQPDGLIRVDFPPGTGREAGARFADLARTLPGVHSATGQFRQIAGKDVPLGGNDTPVTVEGRELRVRITDVAANFPETVGLDLSRGRVFQATGTRTEPVQALVNESFVRAFELTDPVGMRGSVHPIVGFERFRIVGVVEDFHFQSLRNEIEPLIMFHAPRSPANSVYVRAGAGEVDEVISSLQSAYDEVAPNLPFEVHLVDAVLDQQYRTEERWVNLIWWASAIGLGLAGAGLFGLALMAARRREKEISIRKVLGATVTAIVGLFSKEFLRMAAIGVLVGLPVAYLVFERWLSGFAYRIELGPGPFLWATVGTLFLVWVSVSYQSIRAALVNPAATLRNE